MSIDPIAKQKPLLIYDGDCEFCFYWVCYWQRLTGDKVIYKPYQAVQAQFQEIPVEEFKRAVQYVAPDGKISSGAKASYLTLNNVTGKNFWLTLYRKLPGFAFLSEKAYAYISTHRSFFYSLSLFLWGKNYKPPTFDVVSWLFMRGLGLLFFFAFYSFATQALGLIGSQGIIPVSDLTRIVYPQLGALSYYILPMVFWFNASDLAIQMTTWGGAVLSLLLVFNILPRVNLILLFILYLSLCVAGQLFMSFQWDMFLLEAGILAIFLIGWTNHLGIWLLRWLLFRFIFVAGMVKIMSGDPTWRQLSALSYYFMTAPLPTPLAWYAAHLPPAFLTFCTGAALFVELVIPFLIFFPRRLRFFAGFSILLMQILITATGNYNFFNLETILLCIVLFDDAALSKMLPARFMQWAPRQPTVKTKPRRFVTYAVVFFFVFTVTDSISQFILRFGGYNSPALVWMYDSIAPFRIVNTYGPFAIITTTRHEIIFEGSNDGTNWTEYNFKYKPGDVMRPLQWNIPFQPRLDWQMWFAALGYLADNRWLINFSTRLLQNSPAVLGLLETNPFPDKAPKYIRAQLYDYRFTTPEERAKTGALWVREVIGDYMSPASL
jgi:predicted DCC family thiol-disulfide oxidoreductase YuxK